MINKTIFINDSSNVDLSAFGSMKKASLTISGTDLTFIFDAATTVNIVNGALYSSLENSQVTFKFSDGSVVAGKELLKSIDLSHLELERLDASLSESRQERVIQGNLEQTVAEQEKRLEEIKKEAQEVKKEAEKIQAEAQESRNAAQEIEEQLQEVLDEQSKKKIITSSSGQSEIEGDDPFALGKKTKKYDDDAVDIARQLKLNDDSSSSSSSSSASKSSESDVVVEKKIDISLKLDEASDSGIKNDRITNVTSPVFVGSTEPNLTLSFKVDGIVVGTEVSDAMGNFSFTYPGTLVDGEYTVEVEVTDGKGGRGTASVAVTIDTLTDTPTFELDAQYGIPLEDQIPGENLTRFPDAQINGTAEANTQVDVQVNGKSVATVAVNGEGKWSYQFSANQLAEGENAIEIIAEDKAGNRASVDGLITLDTIPPEQPSIILDEASDSGTWHDDRLTNDTTPAFHGTGEPNSKLELFIDNKKIADVVADGYGKWSYVLSDNIALADGLYRVEVVAKDRAGNSAKKALEVEIDTDIDLFTIKMDNASDSGVAGDNYTNNVTPGFSGKTDPSGLIKVTNITTGASIEVQASESGNFTFTSPGTSVEGLNELSISVTDLAGNSDTYSVTYTIDTVPPAPPTLVLEEYVNSQTGKTLTRDTTPTLTGTAEAGSKVIIYLDGKAIDSVTADANQQWSYTPTSTFNEGEHTLSAIAQDLAGNNSPPSPDYTFSVDTMTQAPQAQLDASDDTGARQNDWITNHNDNLLVNGSAEPYASLTLKIDGQIIGTATADASGQWSFEIDPNPALADKVYELTVTATDEVGNQASSSFQLTIDTMTQTPIVQLDASSDTGSASDDAITKDSQPLLKGTAEAGAQVEVFIDGVSCGSVIANSEGIWNYRVPGASKLADGDHSVTVTATDVAGNVANSIPFQLHIDTKIDQPTVTLSNDSGDSSSDLLTNEKLPAFRGEAEPFSSLVLYRDGVSVAKMSANASGQWQYVFNDTQALDDGSYIFYVVATDIAGNSATSERIQVVVDTTIAMPVVDLDRSSDSGYLNDDRLTNDATPTFILTKVDPDVTHVQISVDGVSYDATLNAGVWTLTLPTALSEGQHQITATATDSAGNSATSTMLDIRVDTQTSAPLITLTDDTGVKGDNVSNDTTPGFAIVTDRDVMQVSVSMDGGAAVAATQDGEGRWHYNTTEDLTDGAHTLSVTVTDAAGNTQQNSLTFTIDTQLQTPTIDLVDSADTGVSSADDRTKNTQPSFALGNMDADVVAVEVLIDGVSYSAVNTTGTWSFTPDTPLPDAVYSFQVRATDAAGNSRTSSPLLVTIDTVTAAPAITLTDDSGQPDDNLTNIVTPGFAITTDGDVVQVSATLDNGTAYSATQDSEGRWHFTPPSALADGTHSLTVTVTDSAGNTSQNTLAFSVDTQLQTATVDLVDASDSGISNTDNWTQDSTPTFALGNVDSDAATVEVLINGVSYAAEKNGTGWSFTPNPALPDAIYDVQVRVTDIAGNVTTSAPMPVTIDTTTALPVITLSDDTGVPGDNLSNNVTPGFNITTDVDVVEVMVQLDNGTAVAATKTRDGQWQYTVPAALADGAHTLSVSVMDGAGNSRQNALSFNIDTQLATPTLDLINASDTGSSASDNWTRDATPTFAIGNIDADAVNVEMLINGVSYKAAQDNNGSWEFTPDGALPDGRYDVQVRVTDTAGNVAASSTLQVTIDTVTAAPEITLSDDTGVKGDNLTNSVTPGFAIATDADVVRATVTFDNGTPVSAVKDSDGRWHYNVPAALTEGEHTLTVTVTDGAGNTNQNSLSFTVDTALRTPTVDLLDGSDTGASSTDNLTRDATPSFAIGDVDSDVISVNVLVDGTSYIATKTGDKWSFAPATPLSDGEHEIQVQVADSAGNTATSATLTISVDTVTAAPVITLSDDSGVKGDNITNDTTPGFAIATDSDAALVTVTLDNGAAFAATRDSDGRWHYNVPTGLADGAHTLTVNVTDNAGNTSQNALAFTVDTTISIPTVGLLDASDSGTSRTDNWTNSTLPGFAIGNIDADVVTVDVLIDGISYSAVNTAGTWSFTATAALADGDHSIQIKATDAAGNTATSAALTINVDTVTAAPGIALSDDSGVKGDNVTNNTKPGFAITTDTDVAQVMVTLDNGTAVAATKDSDGMWRFTVPATLTDGAHSLSVTVSDGAGNTNQSSLSFTIDTQIQTPTVDMLDSSDSGISSTDNWTNNAKPTFSAGNLDADVVAVEVLIDGTSYNAVNANGSWSFTPNAPLPDGDHQIQVRATDAAGNIATSATLAVKVDTVTAAPAITLTDDSGVKGDNITNDTTPGFGIVTDSDVATVMVSIDGGAAIAAVKDSDGRWHFNVPAALGDGEHDIQVMATDGAGNTSQSSRAFTVDTGITAPTIDLIDSSDSGISTTDNWTSDTTPTFAIGNVQPDVVNIEVLIDGVSYPAIKSGDSWSFTPGSALNDATYGVQVRATDAAGNVTTSAPLSVTVDTATTAPVITLSDDSGVKGDNLTNDTTPGFAITTDNDAVQVLVSLDNGTPVAALKSSDGNWQFSVPAALAEGDHALSVTVTDRAGNTQQSSLSFSVDTTLSLPTLAIAASDDSGYSDSDGITRETKPKFVIANVDADVHSVKLNISGVEYQAVNNAGVWSFTPGTALPEAAYDVTLTVTDDAGNQKTVTQTVKIDTHTSVDSVTLTDDTGVQNDWRTNKKDSAFSINAPADAHTVTVALDNGQSRSAVPIGGKWVFTLSDTTADGAHVLHITVTDQAGNTAALDQNFVVDTELSPLTIDLLTADDSANATDNITNVRTPRFAFGNIPADVMNVTVTLDGQTTTIRPQSDGTYTFMPSVALADGSYELVVNVTDTAGNSRSSSLSFEVDTVTAVNTITLMNDTGDSATDNLTNASLPKFSVTTPADVLTVVATLNGLPCTVTQTGSGVWEVTAPTLTSNGDYTLVVVATDVAGNQATSSKTITYDNQISLPTIALASADDTGFDANDRLTMNTRPSFIMTNVDADVTRMTVTLKGNTVEVTKDASGNWIYRPANNLTDDTYTLQVEVRDAAGNTRSNSLDFVVDTRVNAPTIDMLTASDTGDSSSDNKTRNTTPQFSFSNLDADVHTLQVSLNNVTYTIAKDAGGNWSWTAPVLTDGSYKLVATATDKAGNVASAELNFEIDTAVTINNVVMTVDSGYADSDRLTNDTSPSFEIQVPADVTHVSVKLDNGSEIDLVKTGGKWTFPCSALGDGAHTLLVTAQDDAGNSTSQTISFEIDTTLLPVTSDLRDADDTGISATDNYTSNGQPTFLFTNVPTDAWSMSVRLNGQDYPVSLSTLPVSFKPSAPLADGSYTLVTTITDKAGNTAESSLTFTVDTTTTVAVDFIEGDDTGYSNSDNYTSVNAPTFEISVPADVVSVTAVLNGVSSVVTKNPSGKWMFTAPTLTEGDHTLVVNVTDRAGNNASTTLPFTVDKTIETPALDLDTSSDTGYSSTDNQTKDTTPSFTVTGVGAADIHLVTITLNGKVYDVQKTGGQWTFQLPSADALADGQYDVSVRSEDNAGNSKTSSMTIVVDTQCPEPVVAMRDADNTGVITDTITYQKHPRFTIGGAPSDLNSITVELNGQSYNVSKSATWWDVPANVNLSDGDYELRVTFTDNVGNRGTTSYNFTLDTAVQGAEIVLMDDSGSNAKDNLTNVNVPRFEVRAGEPLSAVTATLNGSTVQLTKNAQGRWIYIAERTLSDGTYTLVTELTDVAGNKTQSSLTFTIDTQIPTPTIDMNSSSDTGISSSDNLTKNNQPIFTLNNIPSDIDRVQVAIGGSNFNATQNGQGVWTVQPSRLSDGSYTAVVTATDKAGNQAQSSLSFTIDTTIVLSVDLAASSDSGVSQNDKLTNDTTPTLQGMTDAGATLQLTVRDKQGAQVATQNVTPNPDGSWSATLNALAEGEYTVTVRAEDAAGNEKTQSLNIVIDTTTATPSVALTMSDPSNMHEALDLTPEFSGVAEAGATLRIKIDGVAVASVTVDSTGTWQWTPPDALLSGDHLVTVQATDRAGNVSPEASFDFIIPIVDITPPSLMLVNSTDSGALGDFITKFSAPTLTGVTLPGTTVTVYLNGRAAGTTQTDSTGRYSFALPAQAEGTYSVKVSITDPNTKLPIDSDVAQLVIDTHVNDMTWNIPALNENGYLNDKTPLVNGVSEAGARIAVMVDGNVVIETATANDGSWSVTLPNMGADGTHNISLRVTDVAGNVRTFPAQNVVLDTQMAALTVSLRAADDTGASNSDRITSKTSVTLEGTAEANAKVTIFNAAGTAIGSVTAGANGSWSRQITLTKGQNNFVVKAEDAAGNATQKNFSIECDTQNDITDISLTRDSNSGDVYDLITNDKTPSVSALTDPAASVDVYVNNVKVTTIVADASGIATYSLGNRADGAYSVKFISTDLAGNVAESNVATVVVDSVISDFTVSSLPALTKSQAQTMSGTGEAGARVQVTVNGKVVAETTVGNNGEWSMPVVLKNDGDYKVSVTITDIAGNQQTSPEQSIKLDSRTDYPTILLDDSANSSSKNDLITNVKKPSFHGTAEAGANMSILVNEKVVATVTANAQGEWSWQQPTNLADGEYSVRVVAEDAAQNTADSSRILVVVDTATEVFISDFTSDNGIYGNDTITNVKRPVFEIQGENGQPVRVTIDGVYIETLTLNSRSLKYTVPSVLADGQHNISFSITDAAGNTATSGNYSFSIDTVNDTPITLDTVNGSNSADMTKNGVIYVNDVSKNLELSGHAEAGSLVRVSFNGLQVGEVWANASGVWSISVNKIALAEGEISVSVNAKDRGENSKSESFSLVIDTRISQFSVEVMDNKGTSDKWTVNSATNTFFGRGEAGATVTLMLAGVIVASAAIAADGTWQLTAPALSEGNQTLTFTMTDLANNTQSLDRNILVDWTAPDAPTINSSTYIEDSGLWVFSGKGESGSMLIVKDGNGNEVISTRVDANGNWNVVFDYPSDGKLSFVTQDNAGNNSNALQIDEMETHPEIQMSAASDSGVAGDMRTNDTTPTFMLSNIESDVIEVKVTLNGNDYQATLENGSWQFTPVTALADGQYTLNVTATDGGGNSTSSRVDFIIDTTAEAANVSSADDADGTAGEPLVLEGSQPTLQFDFPADTLQASVTFNTEQHSLTLDANHQATFEIPTALLDGPYSLTVSSTDTAGNSQMQTVEFTIDTSSGQILNSMTDEPKEDQVEASQTGNPAANQQTFVNEAMSSLPVDEFTDGDHHA
jgi:sirohydrochlorin ferrochelatase